MIRHLLLLWLFVDAGVGPPPLEVEADEADEVAGDDDVDGDDGLGILKKISFNY